MTRNWLFGWYIVEYEQHGADRPEYGRRLIASLSGKLKAGEVRGCSPTNLRKFREFYRDKEEVRRLASEGQVIEKASDLIKNPLVLEFLDLEEKPVYSESELETAIIDRLQHFLLELGKGFLFEARQKRFTFDNSHFCVAYRILVARNDADEISRIAKDTERPIDQLCDQTDRTLRSWSKPKGKVSSESRNNKSEK